MDFHSLIGLEQQQPHCDIQKRQIHHHHLAPCDIKEAVNNQT